MNNKGKWCLKKDDDGHWYHIPRDKEELFNRLLETALNTEDHGEFINQFDKYRTGGGIQHIDCYPPKE